jgi:hypothetical protein
MLEKELAILSILKIIYKRKIFEMANKKKKIEKYQKNMKTVKKAYKIMDNNRRVLESLKQA